MNPQSLTFVPSDDNYWRLSNTMRAFQEVQDQHGERLRSLERRHDDDGRVKSLWGPTSPFPNAIGTPNHGPIQPPNNEFASFDDDGPSASMVRSLQLDADEEPRRVGATSRANSVRFDESANHGANHWSAQHSSRPSGEFIPRTSSGLGGLGGHPMFERSSSHKSDGKQSSAAHSLVGGRSNSFGLGLEALQPQDDHPGVAPFLSILGSPPAIVRCWLNMDFTSSSMLYAAVCTGSYKSFLDMQLITDLGYSSQIREDITGERKIKLPMYFPEAKSASACSRTSSPAPALPNITVDFAIIEGASDPGKAIRIYIGSDTLRAHNGDVLFSIDCLTLFDTERSKLTVPFARPEDETLFKSLRTIDGRQQNVVSQFAEPLSDLRQRPNGMAGERRPLARAESADRRSTTGSEVDALTKSEPSLRAIGTRDSSAGSLAERRSDDVPESRKTSLTQLNTSRVIDASNTTNIDSPPLTSTSRTSSSPAIWSNWRRDGPNTPATTEWPATSRTGRTAGGIKVLKPARQASRSSGPSSASASISGAISTPNSSTVLPTSSSPTGSQSRFFDDGKRRSEVDAKALKEGEKAKVSKANPIGGASAFSWMNSGGK